MEALCAAQGRGPPLCVLGDAVDGWCVEGTLELGKLEGLGFYMSNTKYSRRDLIRGKQVDLMFHPSMP